MMIGWIAAVSGAQEPCVPPPGLAAEQVSVAWISPVRRRAKRATWLDVVRTTELRAWVARQPQPTVGDLLYALGHRRKRTPPRRNWKVVIFEAPTDALCSADPSSEWTPLRIRWRDAVQRGFCLLPATRWLHEAQAER